MFFSCSFVSLLSTCISSQPIFNNDCPFSQPSMCQTLDRFWKALLQKWNGEFGQDLAAMETPLIFFLQCSFVWIQHVFPFYFLLKGTSSFPNALRSLFPIYASKENQYFLLLPACIYLASFNYFFHLKVYDIYFQLSILTVSIIL